MKDLTISAKPLTDATLWIQAHTQINLRFALIFLN